jgi:hypothetical protein
MKLKCSDGGFENSGIDDLIRCYAIKLISYTSHNTLALGIGSAWLFRGNVL